MVDYFILTHDSRNQDENSNQQFENPQSRAVYLSEKLAERSFKFNIQTSKRLHEMMDARGWSLWKSQAKPTVTLIDLMPLFVKTNHTEPI